MTNLKELLARVEAATWPDRELDTAIAEALRVKQLTYATKVDEPWIIDPPVTASLDAAIALVERCLPEWTWSVWTNEEGCGAHFVDSYNTRTTIGVEMRPTPPLAILATLLRTINYINRRTAG